MAQSPTGCHAKKNILDSLSLGEQVRRDGGAVVTDSTVDGSLGVYLAFGLRLRSDLPLPELPVVAGRGGPPDVEVRVFDAPAADTMNRGAGLADVADDIAMLWWPGIGRFVVSDGSDI